MQRTWKIQLESCAILLWLVCECSSENRSTDIDFGSGSSLVPYSSSDPRLFGNTTVLPSSLLPSPPAPISRLLSVARTPTPSRTGSRGPSISVLTYSTATTSSATPTIAVGSLDENASNLNLIIAGVFLLGAVLVAIIVISLHQTQYILRICRDSYNIA